MRIIIIFSLVDRSQRTLPRFTNDMVLVYFQHVDDIGPVVRFAPHRVDVLSPGIARDAWGGHNGSKIPWDKDPTFCRMLRFGMKVDNLASIQNAREGQRMRRLMGPPFARKFLLDQESIFKNCTERMVEKLNRLRVKNGDIVDLVAEFKRFALDVVSKTTLLKRLMSSGFCIWWVFQGSFEFDLFRR